MSDQVQKKVKPLDTPAATTKAGAVETVDAKSTKDKLDAAINKASGQVTVLYGAEDQTLQLVGKTAGQVRAQLKHLMNVPDDAQARVKGKVVNADYVLADQDQLEFVKLAGQKGVSPCY